MPFSYKPLWKLLIEHDKTKNYLRVELKLSPATIAKMGKGENVALDVIDRICTHFGVQPNDIIEHKPPE